MESLATAATCHHGRIAVATGRSTECIDLTGQIEELAAHVGIRSGLVHIQSLHPTTAIVVNQHEPERLSELDALLPAPSASMNFADGHLQLGRSQRVFLVELDGPGVREVSVVVLGDQ